MAVINVSTAVVRDGQLFSEYVSKAAVLLEALQVEVLCRGRFLETVSGPQTTDHVVAVFKFRDRDHVNSFYQAPDYLPLIPLRDAACNMTIQLYQL